MSHAIPGEPLRILLIHGHEGHTLEQVPQAVRDKADIIMDTRGGILKSYGATTLYDTRLPDTYHSPPDPAVLPPIEIPKIIVSPEELAQFEHVAFDGEHPNYKDRCPVCSGHTDYTTGLIEDYAVLAFPDSPLATRRKEQDHATAGREQSTGPAPTQRPDATG